MRKPTIEDIRKIEVLLITTLLPDLSERLADCLQDIDCETYNGATAVWKFRYVNPTVETTPDGQSKVFVTPKDIRSGKERSRIDIDLIPEDAKYELVSSIWNHLRMNTDEIEHL